LARVGWDGNGQGFDNDFDQGLRYRPGAGRDQLQMPPDRQGQT
jgi:hypothetical protein